MSEQEGVSMTEEDEAAIEGVLNRICGHWGEMPYAGTYTAGRIPHAAPIWNRLEALDANIVALRDGLQRVAASSQINQDELRRARQWVQVAADFARAVKEAEAARDTPR
jgi:hypothetical protein